MKHCTLIVKTIIMKNWLNHFLNKKSDFTENESLKSHNDQYFFLLGEVKKLSNYIVVENIKYYFEYKKAYLTKLLVVTLFKVAVFVGIIVGGLFTLNYFGIVNVSKAIPKPEQKITIYLPDYDTINQQKLAKTFNVVIFFPPNPKKDWLLYKKAVHNIETHGTSDAQSYVTRNASGEYWGRYQLGSGARKIIKMEKYTWKEFSTNPDLQEAAFLYWVRALKVLMQPEINRYSGTFISGVQMTESGIISMAHNAGDGAARSYLNSGRIPDQVLKFAKLGGYKLNTE